MMSSKNNGFTASDIERYHSGQMSPEERHALEKAALDDPFLADALEGYAFTTTPMADLAKIQSRLDEKKQHRKVVPLYQKYRWLSVAALVLIIAGAGWFAYSISTDQKTELARTENAPTKELTRTVPPSQNRTADSSTTLNLITSAETKKKQEEADEAIRKPEASFKAKQGKQLSKNIETSGRAQVASVPEITLPITTQNEVAGNNRLSRARSVDVNRNNVLSSQPTANNASNDVRREQLFLKDNRTTDNNVVAQGKVSGISANDTIKNINVVLQPLPKDSMQSLDEVVVGYGVKKKSTETYPHVTIDTLEPAEGYVNFDAYVSSNLRMPDELKTKKTAGEVQLAFDVDKDGSPVNITVIKSLCDKCDEEAIRLLKEGPKWKKKKNKKGKITFKF